MDPETKTNHGTVTVEALTKAGKARTVYIEPGTYRIALFDVYIDLIPANEEWAGYRIFVGKSKKRGENSLQSQLRYTRKKSCAGFSTKRSNS